MVSHKGILETLKDYFNEAKRIIKGEPLTWEYVIESKKWEKRIGEMGKDIHKIGGYLSPESRKIVFTI